MWNDKVNIKDVPRAEWLKANKIPIAPQQIGFKLSFLSLMVAAIVHGFQIHPFGLTAWQII